jgi:hypothetical protein
MILLLAITSCLSFVQSGARPPDSTVIDGVRHIDISRLDSTLPRIALAEWLRQFVADSANLAWEVNDCGEQTGDPSVDTLRDIPTCVSVESNADTAGGFGIMVGVGSVKNGIGPQPGIYNIYIRTGTNYRTVQSLHELAAILKAGGTRH